MQRMLPDLQLHYGASVHGTGRSWSEREKDCDFPKSWSLLQVKPRRCTLLKHTQFQDVRRDLNRASINITA